MQIFPRACRASGSREFRLLGVPGDQPQTPAFELVSIPGSRSRTNPKACHSG